MALVEGGRPRVRLRVEDRSPAYQNVSWRVDTCVLAADDLFAIQSERLEGLGPAKQTAQVDYSYDRYRGIPVLRSQRMTDVTPRRPPKVSEMKVVERQFGPSPEDEFDPDRFLDGPRVAEPRSDPDPDPDPEGPPMPRRWFWLPFPIGALGLIVGEATAIGTRRDRGRRPPDLGS